MSLSEPHNDIPSHPRVVRGTSGTAPTSGRSNKQRSDTLRWLIAPPKRKRLFDTPFQRPLPSSQPSPPRPTASSGTTCATSGPVPSDCQSVKLAAVLERKVSARQTTPPTPSPQSRSCYFDQTQRPIGALYFVLPLIVIYELAKIFIGLQEASSGIDYWVHQALRSFGIGQLVILPLLTTALLIGWHHRRNDVYSFSPKLLPMMGLEAMGMGLMLFLFANVYQLLCTAHPNAGAVTDPYHWTIGSAAWWSSVITFIGSGIHEELIFRVLLMLPIMLYLQSVFKKRQTAAIFAAIASSILFAAAHVQWLNPAGEPFDEIAFVFRFAASGLFCSLFFYRGFAIAVGTHITYNVLTLLSM